MSRRSLITLAIASVAIFMVTLDNLVVTTALPSIRADLGASLEDLEWTVNAYTLAFAVLPAHRRGARRPLRAAADVPRRDRDLHARVGGRRARALDRRADRRAGDPGARRRDRRPADADAAERGVPGRQARPRARHLVRRRRPRRRDRPARRRRDHREHLVAVDLLGQRAGRPRPAAARAPRAAPRATAPPAGSTCPGVGARHRRPARHRLRHGRGQLARVGRARRSSAPTLAGARCSSPSALWERRSPAPMLPLRFFRSRAFAPPPSCRWRCRSGSSARSSCSPSSSRPCGATAPLEAGLRTLPWTGMPMLVAPIAGVLSDRIGSRPLMAAGLGAAGDRDRVAGGRDGDRRRLHRARPGVRARRHRHGARLLAGRQRDPRRGQAARGGPGVGRQQRDPRARRRPRRRGPGGGVQRDRRLRVGPGVRRRPRPGAVGRRGGAGGRRGRGAAGARQAARGAAPAVAGEAVPVPA